MIAVINTISHSDCGSFLLTELTSRANKEYISFNWIHNVTWAGRPWRGEGIFIGQFVRKFMNLRWPNQQKWDCFCSSLHHRGEEQRQPPPECIFTSLSNIYIFTILNRREKLSLAWPGLWRGEYWDQTGDVWTLEKFIYKTPSWSGWYDRVCGNFVGQLGLVLISLSTVNILAGFYFYLVISNKFLLLIFHW